MEYIKIILGESYITIWGLLVWHLLMK